MDWLKAESLDKVIGTFTRDRQLCEAIATSHAIDVGRLLLYANWTHSYLSPIQEELHAMAARHFAPEHVKAAALWTLTLSAGVGRDLLLVPYFVVRGGLSEAGFALRRSLENVGVLAHLWNEPKNAAFLGSTDAQTFRKAFIWEADPKRKKELKAQGIQKRFERCMMAAPLSNLYSLFSEFTVHGGSPNQLVSTELAPTAFSCALLNRPDPTVKDLGAELAILGSGCEMLCIEVVAIHGTHGKEYGVLPSKGGEGGFYLTRLLAEEERQKAIRSLLEQCGWVSGPEAIH